MPATTLIKRLTRRRIQLTFFGGMAILFLLATAFFTAEAFYKLKQYGSAGKDNIQWTMTQLEVDHAKLLNAAERLESPSADRLAERLADLRKRFDIFYSRATTLRDSTAYQQVLAGTGAKAQLNRICATLDPMIPVIDGSDQGLLLQQPELARKIAGLTAPVRRLSSIGIAVEAGRNQSERKALTANLVHLTVLSLLMLTALLSLLFLLWQLYQRYRRRALENRTNMNRLTTILNTSQDAILVVGRDGRIIQINGSATSMFSLPSSGGDDMTISQFLFRSDEADRITPLSASRLIGSCTNGRNICTKLVARGARGREFPVELCANLVPRSGRDVCVCFIRDISHRVAVEAEMKAARDKALAGERAKASFLGMISHEMRTPLSGILGALDLLRDTDLTAEQQGYAQIMQSSGQLVLGQVNDALDVTLADGGRLALNTGRFDLDHLLDDLMQSQQPTASAKGISLRLLRPKTTLGLAMGDQSRLHQVLLNLITNAVKFTETGEITIEVSRPGPEDDRAGEVEFQISDTGIGIPADDLPRIFDDFVRLGSGEDGATDGAGLGLGITRQLVTLMQGTIGAESVTGEGSLFWVRLPLPRVAADDTAAAFAAEIPVPPGPLDVLVVEDNSVNRFVLCEMLRKDGHKVVQACNGSEGVAKSEAQQFDLIVMDISMPGIDGIETTRRIRAGGGASATSRIVALTAHLHPDQNDRLKTAQFDAVHTKPLRLDALRGILSGKPTPGQTPTTGTNIDAKVLDQLGSVLPSKRLSALLKDFISEGAAFIESLPDLRALPADEQAARLHAFAGLAATFGAVALQSALNRAEASAKTSASGDDRDQLHRTLQQLPGLWQATLSELDTRRHAA